MDIQNETVDKTGRFYIEANKETIAELDYQFPDKNTLLIVHTEVDGTLEGRGIGRRLVAAAVDYARENSLHLRATCPFAKKVLDRSKEYADVYHPEKSN